MTRAILFLSVLLSGCAMQPKIQAPPMIIHEPKLSEQLPKSLTQCKNEPSGSAVETNGDAESYILDLRAAGRDCRKKLNAVRKIIYGAH